jgi:hypothetical protein
VRRIDVLVALGLFLTVAAPVAAATKPVAGSISGPVVSVKGDTFTVTTTLSPTGKSKVTVATAATITEQVAASSRAVKKGVCVMATGTKSAKGVVTATRVTITAPVKGSCTTGLTRRGGNGLRPGGGAPQAGGGGFNFANLGFAFGQVTAVKGTKVAVKSARGTTPVTLSKKTLITETKRVAGSAIAVKSCAFVRGTSADKGVTVTATNVSLTTPTTRGCTFGFRRP